MRHAVGKYRATMRLRCIPVRPARRRTYRALLVAGAAGISALGLGVDARGMTIAPTFDFSQSTYTGSQQTEIVNAFNAAAQQFTQRYTNDNITINVTVQPVSGTGTLGQSDTQLAGFLTYDQMKNVLATDAVTPAEISSVAALASDPTGGGLFALASAEAKTLGLLPGNLNLTDGIFQFGDGYNYSFDPNSVGPGQIDFNGVASHELTEIMGRIPGLGTNFGSGGPDYLPYDLMRFIAPGIRSVTTGNGAYFSIDNGTTDLKNFNNSLQFGGDPQDWASGTNDSFNAFTSFGASDPVTAVDYQVMDVLGYNNMTSVVYSGFTTNGPSTTQNANWGTSVPNFSGVTYTDGTQAVFGDTDANQNNVTSSTVTIQAAGVNPAVVTFVNNSVTYTFTTTGSVGIGGSAAVVLAGSGTVNFASPNTYSGGTVITSGTLRANNGFSNGSATGTNTVTINGGTLGGNGAITGPVVMTEGAITAGSDTSTPGKLAVTGATTISGGTQYLWKINNGLGAAGSTNGWDDITTSALTFTGLTTSLPFTITLESFNGANAGNAANTSTGSDSWVIAESAASISINGSTYANNTMLTGPGAGALSGLFVLSTSGFNGGQGFFSLEVAADPNGGQALELNYVAAPEPCSAALAMIGCMPLLIARRQNRDRCAT